MSQLSPDDISALVSYYKILETSTFFEIAATALVLFEYCVTFSEEVRYIWRRRNFSGGSAIFLVNRYIVILNRIARMIQVVLWIQVTESTADESDHPCRCNIVWRFSEVFTITLYVTIAVFSALRMYALWNKDMKIALLVICLGMINPCVNAYYDSQLTFESLPPPFRGCGQSSSFTDPNEDLALFIFGSVFTIFFESVVLILTWIKTADYQHTSYQKAETRTSISRLLWLDGTIYFVTLLTLTSISLLSIRIQALNNMPALTDSMVSICLSRFILHLRDHNEESAPRISQMSGSWGSRIIGNLGAHLKSSTEHDSEHPITGDMTLQLPNGTLLTGIIAEERSQKPSTSRSHTSHLKIYEEYHRTDSYIMNWD